MVDDWLAQRVRFIISLVFLMPKCIFQYLKVCYFVIPVFFFPVFWSKSDDSKAVCPSVWSWEAVETHWHMHGSDAHTHSFPVPGDVIIKQCPTFPETLHEIAPHMKINFRQLIEVGVLTVGANMFSGMSHDWMPVTHRLNRLWELTGSSTPSLIALL